MNESSTGERRRQRETRAASAPLRSAQELGQKTSAEANRRAAGILETLAGVRSAPEVAAALGLSLPYFYLLERKALDGLVRACEAQPKGPAGPSADEQLARVRRELAQTQRECQRLTALVRVTQRAVGLAPPATEKETKPLAGGKSRRRRRRLATRRLELRRQLMAGRKPLLLGHVDSVDGSDRAKCRLRNFVGTLSGTISVSEACRDLDLHESQFHELRRDWIRKAADLLEPRPLGRPRRSTTVPLAAAEHERLTSENAELRRQLQTLQQRVEIERILAAPTAAPKKTAKPR